MSGLSVYLVGFVSIGFGLAARAGDAGYSDPGILQINYVILTPAAMFGVAMIAEFWVECLPSQVKTGFDISSGGWCGTQRPSLDFRCLSNASNWFCLIERRNNQPRFVRTLNDSNQIAKPHPAGGLLTF